MPQLKESPNQNFTNSVIIGQNIAARRRAIGLSQEKLALLLGYSGASAIYYVERGRSIPAEYLPVIATALKVKDCRDFFIKDKFTD